MLKKKKKKVEVVDKKIFGLGEFVAKASGDDSEIFTAVISGIKTDRYGDTVNPEGWDLKNFKRNPVLLWAHDHRIPTVGSATKVWVEGKELMMNFKFAPTPFAQELKTLVVEGFLKAFSVGFMTKAYEFNKNDGIDFLEQELLECSFVNVPAYAEALMKSVEANSDKYKNFIKGSEGTLNWDSIMKSDYRENLLKEKNVEEEKVIFSKSEFEKFKKDLEVKAGKVLSKKNRDLINEAISVMENAIAPLKELLEATTDDKKIEVEEEKKKTLDFSNFDEKKLDEELDKVLKSK